MELVSLPQRLSDLIPTDIHEYIITFLYDRPTLKSCSLTCKAWLRPSWKALFELCIICIHRKNIDAFLDLIDLNTRTLTFIHFIKHLHVEQGGSQRLPQSGMQLGEMGDYEIFQFDDFLHQLVGLTAVRTLRLGWVRCDTSASTSAALRNNFANVTTLDLDSMILSSPEHFFDILGAFPLLSCLSLTGVLFNGGRLYDGLDNWEELDARRTELNSTPPPPSNLRELHANVTEDVAEFLFSWMTYHDNLLPMHSLSIGLFSQSSNAALSKFLAHSGSSLQNLMFRDVHESTDLDLSPCVNLRALEIGCVYLQSLSMEDSREQGSETFITDVLHTVTSEQVGYIKLVLSISRFEDAFDQLFVFDWRGLLLILGQSQFKDLVLVEISVPGHESVVEQMISSCYQDLGPALGSAPRPIFRVTKWTRS